MNELAKYDKPSDFVKIAEDVKAWMLEGQSMVDIIEALHEKGINQKNIKECIEKAQKEWVAIGNVDQDQLKGFARAGLMHMYKKMVEIGDYANAAKTLKDLAKI